jgi:hypothetical protein
VIRDVAARVSRNEEHRGIVGPKAKAACLVDGDVDPGVPACLALGTPQLALALKSGNFGAPDFFMKALDTLQ